ncbi:MAG: PhnD/SsuA/transferrin family substrate-binding protein [Planctomycetes bacterium]|nr:PhnD/SsuA/transferrin family substrate-binding protein [Planctomycetota bacterium]
MTQPDAENSNRSGAAAVIVAALLLGTLLVGVGLYTRQRESGSSTPGRPLVLLLSKEHAAGAEPKDLETLATFLKTETGQLVEVRTATSVVSSIDSFDNAADIGLLHLFEYLLARSEHGVEPRLQLLRKRAEPSFAGEILVRADGPVKSVADLAGKKFGFVDPYSTSGYIFPARLLAEAKVRVAAEFCGSHDDALRRLKEGGVEAIATYSGRAVGDATLRVLTGTGTIPNEPVFFRRTLDAALQTSLTAALVKFSTTPEGQQVLSHIAGTTGLQPVTDSAYDDVRATIKGAGKSLYEVVPEGMDVESRRRALAPVPW